MFSSIYNFFTKDIAIDLGTANTLVHIKNEGIVINEPSIVAISKKEKHSICFGFEAKEMLGKNPDIVDVIKPMKDGVIADFRISELMLRHLIKRASRKNFIIKPKVVVCVPSGITEVEKRAVRDSILNSGAREVFLISEPVAAAIGADMPIKAPQGNLIIDIGGGTTEIAILSLSNIVAHNSIRIGGDKMDSDIVNYMRVERKVFIGLQTAENIKKEVGSAKKLKKELGFKVRGRDIITGLPTSIEVSSQEIRAALADTVDKIATAVVNLFEKTPPELTADIALNGVFITGGGSLLKNMDTMLKNRINLPVHLVPNPLTCVVRGTGIVLENIKKYADVLLKD